MESTRVVRIDLGERTYEIVVGRGLLRDAGNYVKAVIPGERVIIVTDEHVATHHLATLQAALDEDNVAHETATMPAGEETKSFGHYAGLCEKLLSFKPDRKTTLIALGGGVVGDITGFVAATLLRGVPFIQIPTTLLAMVDSSVGGKTGINTDHGKNLIGAFHQPRLVLADLAVLETLPKRQLQAGYAEIVKYGLIHDSHFFDELEKRAQEEGEQLLNSLHTEIYTSCKVKADIVEQDEREQGMRALLNLGHTFGHALEAEMGYDGRLLHGEAVSIGMVMAFYFSSSLKFSDEADAQRVEQHLKLVGLPTHPKDIAENWNIPKLVEHMKQDKKVTNGLLTFILAKRIGKAFIQAGIDEVVLATFIEQFLARK